MRLLFRIYAKPAALLTLTLSFLLAAAIPLLAGDVGGALYRADVVVTNTSYTATRVSVPFTLNTQALIDGYYLESDFSNVALQTATGTDIPFMPAVGSGDDWMMFGGQVGQNSSQNYVLYTGGPDMGGSIYYFPDDGGMTTSDSASLELGNDFEIEIDGYVDTDAGADKNLVIKTDALKIYISNNEEITATATLQGATAIQEQNTSSTGNDSPFYGANWRSQTFEHPTDFFIVKVEMRVKRFTTPGDLTLSIRDTAGDLPTGGDLVFKIVDSNGFPGALTWVTITFDVPYELTGGTRYAIVVRVANQTIQWFYDAGGNPYANGQKASSGNSGVDWTGQANDDFTFKVWGYEGSTASVTAAGVASGEHKVKVTADTVDLKIYIDDVEKDSAPLSGASVPDNANGWTFLANYSVPYMDYQKIWVGGTLQQHIIWENSATFTDQSGNGHDATPTFRSTSTDPDVTAVVKNFNAVTHAAFSSGTDDEIPEMVLAPEESIDLHRRMENTDQLPGGAWVNSFMDDIGWPRELFWFTFVFGIAVLLTNVAFRFTKDLFPTALAPAIWVVLFASAGVVPWAALWPCAVVSIGEIIRRRVVAIG